MSYIAHWEEAYYMDIRWELYKIHLEMPHGHWWMRSFKSGHARVALDSKMVLPMIKYVNLCHQIQLLFTLALLLRVTVYKYAILLENLWTVNTPVGVWV